MSISSAPSRPTCARATTRRCGARAIFVDTRAGASKEAGDIVQPLKAERHRPGRHRRRPARTGARREDRAAAATDEITLFKSVGAALEDLAAGIAVYEALRPTPPDQRLPSRVGALLRRPGRYGRSSQHIDRRAAALSQKRAKRPDTSSRSTARRRSGPSRKTRAARAA